LAVFREILIMMVFLMTWSVKIVSPQILIMVMLVVMIPTTMASVRIRTSALSRPVCLNIMAVGTLMILMGMVFWILRTYVQRDMDLLRIRMDVHLMMLTAMESLILVSIVMSV